VRHVADLGLGDGLDDGGCWGGHGVSSGWSATSTVGVCARRAASPSWVAPRPGVGSVADASSEASLDAVVRLGEGCGEFVLLLSLCTTIQWQKCIMSRTVQTIAELVHNLQLSAFHRWNRHRDLTEMDQSCHRGAPK